MRPRRFPSWLILGSPALVALVLAGGLACPLAHDGYETDRPCWDRSDCVAKERCERGDAGTLSPGTCNVPSDGPCGPLDAGTAGFYCFPNAQGDPELCFYEPQYLCLHCDLDGSLPDGGCPVEACLTWRDHWRCQ
jgi:hypothetical protein